jgi:hypothetical protein
MRSYNEIIKEASNVDANMSLLAGSDLGNDTRSLEVIDYLRTIADWVYDGSKSEQEIRAYLDNSTDSEPDEYDEDDVFSETKFYHDTPSNAVCEWLFSED